MHRTLLLFFAVLVTVAFAQPLNAARDDRGELLDSYLEVGDLAGAEKEFSRILRKHPADDQVRFALAVVQTLRAGEAFSQELYQYGPDFYLRPLLVPGSQLPGQALTEPEKIDYCRLREMLRLLVADLDEVIETLDGIRDADFLLNVSFGKARLDLDGDNVATEDEALWKVWAELNPQVAMRQGGMDEFAQNAESFVVGFDRADVHWLRSYIQLVNALSEIVLAHDMENLFNRTAQLYFPNVNSPYPYLQYVEAEHPDMYDFEHMIDVVALIHLASFDVQDPELLEQALHRMRIVVWESRATWEILLTETDDENEWIPNPAQTAAIPGAVVTQEMADTWLRFLDEVELLLRGKKLIPFWRGEERLGVNLRRVFTEPARFDLALWIQGSAADPYLEQGDLTPPGFWQRLDEVYEGNFLGFALWVN